MNTYTIVYKNRLTPDIVETITINASSRKRAYTFFKRNHCMVDVKIINILSSVKNVA